MRDRRRDSYPERLCAPRMTMRLEGEADCIVFQLHAWSFGLDVEAEPEPVFVCAEKSGSILRPMVGPIRHVVGNGATVVKIMSPFRTPAYSTEGEERAMRSEAGGPAAVTFEREVATRLRSDCPRGWIAHDVYVGEEQIDVLAVLPQGIFAIECKAYHGQIVGDPNSAWLAHTNGRTTVLAPRSRNPYRQVLRKAFAIGDFLTAVLQANHPSSRERPWIYACVVVPHTTELSGIRGVAVNPQFILPHGQGRALLFQPASLSAYIEKMSPEMDSDVARALVVALGGAVDGTWLEQKLIRQAIPRCVPLQPRPRLRLQIVWEY